LVTYQFRAFPAKATHLVLPFENDSSMASVFKGSIGEKLIREAKEEALQEGIERGQGQGARKEKLVSRFRMDMELVVRLSNMGSVPK
jgi:hypothetical protein